jgi:hypothetical protein
MIAEAEKAKTKAGLSSMELAFARGYAVADVAGTLNARSVAILAGYSPKSASQQATMLAKRPKVRAAINQFRLQLLKNTEAQRIVSVELIRDELRRVQLLAEEKGDLATATRNVELIGKTIGAFRDGLDLDLSTSRQYSPVEREHYRRVSAVLLAGGSVPAMLDAVPLPAALPADSARIPPADMGAGAIVHPDASCEAVSGPAIAPRWAWHDAGADADAGQAQAQGERKPGADQAQADAGQAIDRADTADLADNSHEDTPGTPQAAGVVERISPLSLQTEIGILPESVPASAPSPLSDNELRKTERDRIKREYWERTGSLPGSALRSEAGRARIEQILERGVDAVLGSETELGSASPGGAIPLLRCGNG